MKSPLRSNSAMSSKPDQLLSKEGLDKSIGKIFEKMQEACPYNDFLAPVTNMVIEVADSWPGDGAQHDKIPCAGSVLDYGTVPR